MRIEPIALSLVLAAAPGSVAVHAEDPIACNLRALNDSERDRHHALGEKLRSVAKVTELPDGYALALDLKKLPMDAQGKPWCVVEVAQWADMESRCCPFLNFGIDLQGKDGFVVLRLTGGEGVKDFLKMELGLDGPAR
jgi:hypothetical protein